MRSAAVGTVYTGTRPASVGTGRLAVTSARPGTVAPGGRAIITRGRARLRSAAVGPIVYTTSLRYGTFGITSSRPRTITPGACAVITRGRARLRSAAVCSIIYTARLADGAFGVTSACPAAYRPTGPVTSYTARLCSAGVGIYGRTRPAGGGFIRRYTSACRIIPVAITPCGCAIITSCRAGGVRC